MTLFRHRFAISTLFALLLVLAGSAAIFGPAIAQPPPGFPNSPYNVPAVNPPSGSLTPLANSVLTLSASGTGTYATNVMQNIAYNGALCTYNQASHTGSPSSQLEIDAYDQASNTYQKWVQSAAITADTTPTSVIIYPGAALTTTPTGMVLESLHLPRYFRVQLVVGGTGETVTGTVGCDMLK